MQTIRTKQAWYKSFTLGQLEPLPIECTLAIVEANGKRYLKTPFAFRDAYADDDIERQIDGRRYFATAEECAADLAYEYRWHIDARPIMEALLTAIHHYGELVGASRIADKIGYDTNGTYIIARGHRRYTLKQVRAAVKALQK